MTATSTLARKTCCMPPSSCLLPPACLAARHEPAHPSRSKACAVSVSRDLCLNGLCVGQVANRRCGMGNAGCRLVSSCLWVLQPRHLAFYMATHRRLGADPKCLLSNLVVLPALPLASAAGDGVWCVCRHRGHGMPLSFYPCASPRPKLTDKRACDQDECVLKMITELASADTGVGARALAQVLEEGIMPTDDVASAVTPQHLPHEGAAGEGGTASRQRRASTRGKGSPGATSSSPLSAGGPRRRMSSRAPEK